MSEGRKTPVQQQAQRRPAPAQSSLFQDFFQLGRPAPPPDELPVGRDMQKPFCLILFVVMIFAGYYAFLIWPPVLYLPSSFSDLPDYYPQSRIVRDTWGIPHCQGQTDAEVAFALGYAHCEDDFYSMQESLLASRGLLATLWSERGIENDHMVLLSRVWDFIEANFQDDSQVSPQLRALCLGYAEGVNYFAHTNPKKLITEKLFPVTPDDVIASVLHKGMHFSGFHRQLKHLLNQSEEFDRIATPFKGTSFAVSSDMTEDASTFLLINPHAPWGGPSSVYEVHARSEEGWDMTGGTFPGCPIILMGHNKELGWSHTLNEPDIVDIYSLTMDPKDPYSYLFDVAWLKLERRIVDIEVQVYGRYSRYERRELLWSPSHNGPVVVTPHGTYAIRYSGIGRIGMVEQWYRMNKARTFEEWLAAMRMQQLPSLHTVYADRHSNIFYVYNALVPADRSPHYDWSGILPGNTSETLWHEYLPFDMLPNITNPKSKFVQSCDSSPFNTTTGVENNPQPSQYSPTLGIETYVTNRGQRALELFDSILQQQSSDISSPSSASPSHSAKMSYKDFVGIKFDMRYSKHSHMAKLVNLTICTFETHGDKNNKLLRRSIEVLRQWDLGVHPQNVGAPLGVISFGPYLNGSLSLPYPPNTHNEEVNNGQVLLWRVNEVASMLHRSYGRVDPEWGIVNQHTSVFPALRLGGGPDVLHTVSGNLDKGKIMAAEGDSLVMAVRWDKQGRVHSEAVQPLGSAVGRSKKASHHADQAVSFSERHLRPVRFGEREIQENTAATYRPGRASSKRMIKLHGLGSIVKMASEEVD